MASNAQSLSFAIRAVNEASAVLKTVQGDIDQLGSTAESNSGRVGKLGGAIGEMSKIAGGFVMGAGLLALPGVVGGIIGSASDMNESLSKVNTVFGSSAGGIESWASSAAKNLGMTKGAALEASGTFGNFLQAMGTTTPEAADMSKSMVQLATDLGSFNNANPEEVLMALRSGLSGEAEPLRKFGVAISAAAVDAKALEMGLIPVGGELTEQQKIMARYAIIMDQTKTAQGDFERTSGGLANQTKILKAQLGDMSTQIGTALLPAIVAMAGAFINMMPVIASVGAAVSGGLGAAFGAIASVFGVLQPYFVPIVAGIGAVAAVILGSMIPAGLAWVAVEWAKVTAFMASAAAFVIANAPLIAIAITIGLVVAAVILLVQNWDVIVAKFPILGTIADGVQSALGVLAGFITGTLWPAIQSIATVVIEAVGSAVGFVIANWPTIQAPFVAFIGFLTGTVFPIVSEIATTVAGAIGRSVGFVQDNWPLIQATIGVLLDWIGNVFQAGWAILETIVIEPIKKAIGYVQDNWPLISATIGVLIEWATNVFQAGWGAIKGYIIDPIETAITWVTNNIGRITGPLDTALGKIKDIGGAIGGIAGKVPGFADGTASFRGGLAIVGERGPELAVLPGGTAIIPNEILNQLPRFANGGVMPYSQKFYGLSKGGNDTTFRDHSYDPANVYGDERDGGGGQAWNTLDQWVWRNGGWVLGTPKRGEVYKDAVTGEITTFEGEEIFAAGKDTKTGKPNTRPKGMSQYIYDNWEMFYGKSFGNPTTYDPGVDTSWKGVDTSPRVGQYEGYDTYAEWFASRQPDIYSGSGRRGTKGGGTPSSEPPPSPLPIVRPVARRQSPGAGDGGITVNIYQTGVNVANGAAVREGIRQAMPIISDELDKRNTRRVAS